MSDILDTILGRKREEIAALQRRIPEPALRQQAIAADPVRGFARALRLRADQGRPAVIAEIKKASPSKGLIRENFDPASLARDYAAGGASCLSILTDHDFFQGTNDHLQAARGACGLPVIRKDFMIHPLQILEARALGADCVLLIAAALTPPRMAELAVLAASLNMDVLVEIHDRAELESVCDWVLPRTPALLGINNRDLRTFETRLETTLELLPLLPADCEVVTESGIATPADIARMCSAGVMRFLIGESLMRQASPGAALQALLA